MTPKERAEELVGKFTSRIKVGSIGSGLTEYNVPYKVEFEAKECALICVDEILKHLVDTFIPNSAAIMAKDDKDICYWQAVKSEIENM